MAEYDSYTPKLTEESKKKAKDELNELPEENRAQLKQFADWIDVHKKWITAPKDPVFLMSFLRVRKFSQLLARETLVNFFTTREKESQYFKKLTCDDPKILSVVKSTFFVPFPKRDVRGRQVFLLRPAKLDISGKPYKMVDVLRMMLLVFEHVQRDEDVQVNGVVLFVDLTNSTLKHESFGGEHRLKSLKFLTKTYPFRIGNIVIYNGGPVMEVVMALLKTALSEKIKQRLVITSDMTKVYDVVDKKCLPLEYLPDDYTGDHVDTCENINDNLINNLKKPENRKWSEELSSGGFRVDESKMPPREELFQEAFRKLNVD